MSYNLTDKQKDFVKWMVQQVRDDNLSEEFVVVWLSGGAVIQGYKGDLPEITEGLLDTLVDADMLHCRPSYRSSRSRRTYESSRICVLKQRAYDAVDSNFEAPDTSFVTHLTPLADITNLDSEIKTRCFVFVNRKGTRLTTEK